VSFAHNRPQPRRNARREHRQRAISPAPSRARDQTRAARHEGSKSLPTLANTFGVKMPFSCATHFSFSTAFSPFIHAVSVAIHEDSQK
jgi:hypothetical protein